LKFKKTPFISFQTPFISSFDQQRFFVIGLNIHRDSVLVQSMCLQFIQRLHLLWAFIAWIHEDFSVKSFAVVFHGDEVPEAHSADGAGKPGWKSTGIMGETRQK
jgi:hypothetical protein